MNDKEKLEAIEKIVRYDLVMTFNKIQNIDYEKSRMERTLEKEVYNDIQKIKTDKQKLVRYWYHNIGFSCVCVWSRNV